MLHTPTVPDHLPVLSRGKHRSPRRGACFMEYASVLAGERWSDHPACTHALLGEVARNANDRTSDAGRRHLAPLIPSVIGLTPDDPRTEARIALRCAVTALPVAPADAQRSLAVGVLACDAQLAALGDPETTPLRQAGQQALQQVPDAARWAVAFSSRPWLNGQETSPKRFRRYSAPGIVNIASHGIAEAAVVDPDPILLRMLQGAIDECRALAGVPVPSPVVEQRWLRVRGLTT